MKNFGFGTMRLPLLNSDDPTSIDFEQVNRMVDRFLEQGFTYVDTAYPYHEEQSEIAVRECLVKRHPRDSYLLADKMPTIKVTCTEDYQKYFDEQLEKCGVDYFDYYLLHNLGQDRFAKTEEYGGFEFMKQVKAKGQAKYIGFSFHDSADMLDAILTAHPEMDFVQLQINYLDWDSTLIQSGKCYEVAKKHGKKVVVMEPVKGGMLANLPAPAREVLDKYGAADHPASYAIRFAASLPEVFMVLSGMSNLEQLEANTAFMADFQPLSEQEQAMVKEVASVMTASIEVPCTACKYCTEVCPKNINIPGYFALLNAYKLTHAKTNMYYQRIKMNRGAARECVKCGKCENICPQHIAIREGLVKFADLYEV